MFYSFWPLAEFDLESVSGLIWLVIVVGGAIIQLINKSQTKKPKPGHTDTPATAESPSAELQQFLDSLRGSSRPVAKPPDTPPPVVPAPTVPTARQATPRAVQIRKTYAAPPGRPAIKKGAAPAQATKTGVAPQTAVPEKNVWAGRERPTFRHFKHGDVHAADPKAAGQGLRRLRAGVADDLIDLPSLRKALVLREILGPPPALRKS
jgi:hypothetical protein